MWIGGLRGAGTLLALVHIGCHHTEASPGRRSPASSRVPAAGWSQKPASEPPRERCMRVSDSAAVAAADSSSKSYLEGLGLTPAPCAWIPEFSPLPPCPAVRGSAGEGPTWGIATPPPHRPPLTGKTREMPPCSAFPGNPLSRRVAGRPWAPNPDHRPASPEEGLRPS